VPRILPGEKGKRCVTILITVVNSISTIHRIIAGSISGVAAAAEIACRDALPPGRKLSKGSRGI